MLLMHLTVGSVQQSVSDVHEPPMWQSEQAVLQLALKQVGIALYRLIELLEPAHGTQLV
jgi:hypothetical protein